MNILKLRRKASGYGKYFYQKLKGSDRAEKAKINFSKYFLGREIMQIKKEKQKHFYTVLIRNKGSWTLPQIENLLNEIKSSTIVEYGRNLSRIIIVYGEFSYEVLADSMKFFDFTCQTIRGRENKKLPWQPRK
jgi:hypothetical protein